MIFILNGDYPDLHAMVKTFILEKIIACCTQLIWERRSKMEILLTKLQHKLIRTMWKEKKSSRAKVGKALGVNPSTISRNLAPLIEHELVKIVGESPASSKGGRKAKILSFNEKWKKIIGISVEQGEVTVVLTDLQGNVLKKDYEFMDVNATNIVNVVKEKFLKYSDEDILGVSVATPGIVSSESGRILFSSALGIRDLELENTLEETFKRKVLVMNNANAASAFHFMKSNDLVYFIFSIPYDLKRPIGIGAGIMINGKIHEGYNSQAGEFWKSFALTSQEGLTVKDLQDETVIKMLKLDEFVDYFSDFLEIAVNIVDPEMYVVGGDVSLLPKWVGEKLINKVYKKIPYRSVRKLRGVVDTGGTVSIARGAALAFASKMMEKFNFAKETFSFLKKS